MLWFTAVTFGLGRVCPAAPGCMVPPGKYSWHGPVSFDCLPSDLVPGCTVSPLVAGVLHVFMTTPRLLLRGAPLMVQ